ncbi:MAG: S-layer protein [Schwartzia succinivorans]|nr:S-layer protein [Schwartzia succinivorans]
MKRAFVSTCAAALLAASASTAFAAANPFEDVPADHWAYDAISQLAAEGVIEGYGDGSYRGDQAITRFEMAQMIARAMAKGGGNKALLDKLAAEFADELHQLGIRVANLEKKVDNVTYKGTVRYRYITTRSTDGILTRTADQYLTLRLEPSMQINKHWTGHARIDYNTSMDTAENTTGNTRIAPDPAAAVIAGTGLPGLRIERIWVQGDYDHLHILLGKLPYISNADRGMIFDDNVAGGQITFGNKVKMTVTAGRSKWYEPAQINADFDPQPGAEPGAVPEYTYSGTGSYFSAEVYNDRADKWTWGLGFHRWTNGAALTQEINSSSVNIWDVGVGYKFNKNLSLHGAYAWTTSPDQEAADAANPATGDPGHAAQPITGDAKRAWSIELDYKKANPAKKGSWGSFLAYRYLGAFAVIVPTYDAMGYSERGVEVGVDYVFAKNIMGTVKYFFGKKLDDEASAEGEPSQTSHYRLFTELNFFF